MPLEPNELELIVREVMTKTAREQPSGTVASATVTDVGTSASFRGSWATVTLDEDPSGEARQVAVAVGNALAAGDRVLVLFDPPHGGYIIGVIDGGSAVCLPMASFATYQIDNGSGIVGSELDVELLNYDPDPSVADGYAALTVNCGFTLSDYSGSGDLDSIIVPETGVYMLSLAAHFGPANMALGDIGELTIYTINKGGIFNVSCESNAPGGASGHSNISIGSFAVHLEAGDLVYLRVNIITDNSGNGWHNILVGWLTIEQMCCGFEPEPFDTPTTG